MRLAEKIAPEDGVAAATLALIAATAWFCFIRMNAAQDMPGMVMAASLGSNFAMWEVMALAMMTPMLVLPVFAAEHRGAAFTLIFAAGYFAVWSAFALLAAAVEQALSGAGRWVLFAFLAAAGLYQWTTLKTVSLEACRRRAVPDGAGVSAIFRGGLRYGVCCLGCCWLLMALMIATGMSAVWVTPALTIAMLGERLLPQARYITGAACVVLSVSAFMQR